MSRSLLGNVPAVLVTRASPDMWFGILLVKLLNKAVVFSACSQRDISDIKRVEV